MQGTGPRTTVVACITLGAEPTPHGCPGSWESFSWDAFHRPSQEALPGGGRTYRLSGWEALAQAVGRQEGE